MLLKLQASAGLFLPKWTSSTHHYAACRLLSSPCIVHRGSYLYCTTCATAPMLTKWLDQLSQQISDVIEVYDRAGVMWMES